MFRLERREKRGHRRALAVACDDDLDVRAADELVQRLLPLGVSLRLQGECGMSATLSSLEFRDRRTVKLPCAVTELLSIASVEL